MVKDGCIFLVFIFKIAVYIRKWMSGTDWGIELKETPPALKNTVNKKLQEHIEKKTCLL
jgi:hypothetical protein